LKVFLFKIILKLSQWLSLKKGRAFARFIARIIWKRSKKIKHITLTNIQKCYPNLSESQQLELAQNSISATLMNMMELGKVWDKNTTAKDFVQNYCGIQDFSNELKQNKGLLLAVPHMGNWEVLNIVLEQFDKYAFLYKPPADKRLEALLVKYRSKSKALQIEANIKGVRKIMMHFKDNGLVSILPDQRPKQGQGIFAPFYGIPTYTMSLFSKLAIKTKVPVYFAYALRTEQGFDVYFEKSDEAIYSDLTSSVAYMNQKIQSIVDKAPEQYQWTYKRFSIQGEGEPPFY
jgi:KDO2-lipid IV(A) lauroyltransferase